MPLIIKGLARGVRHLATVIPSSQQTRCISSSHLLYRSSDMFKSFQRGPVDPMFILKKKADEDVSPEKADLGVGIYRNEAGLYSELDSVKQVGLSLSTRCHGI